MERAGWRIDLEKCGQRIETITATMNQIGRLPSVIEAGGKPLRVLAAAREELSLDRRRNAMLPPLSTLEISRPRAVKHLWLPLTRQRESSRGSRAWSLSRPSGGVPGVRGPVGRLPEGRSTASRRRSVILLA